MSLPEFGGMDTGFNYYHGAEPGEYDLVVSNSEGGARAAARARRTPRRVGLLGGRPRALLARCGREGARRLLLRLRRQVPARVDARARRRAVAQAPRCGLRSGRRRLPGRCRTSAAARRVPFNGFNRAISSTRIDAQHHSPRARDRPRLVDRSAVRARDVGRGDRLEPDRGDRDVVRAGSGLARRARRRRGDDGVPRSARATPARPRSSARVRASGLSTSTRTRTGPTTPRPVGLGVRETVA